MSFIDPANLTVQDLCTQALKEAGVLGTGQTALADDIFDAQGRLQLMLQQWERKRWLVYHLNDIGKTSTGAQSYSVGPGADFDTGAGLPRPDKISSAFLRQLTQSQPNQIDYPLTEITSREDYNRISLKQLTSFPAAFFYDSGWPNGTIYPWPIPQASIYALHITVKEQLPAKFATGATAFNVPYEYYAAMLYNLALRLCPKYGLAPNPAVVAFAKDGLATVRGANTQISTLHMPGELVRPSIYNIFSDQAY